MDCILHVLDYTELHSEVNHPRRCLTHYICASKSLLGGRVSQHRYERGSFIVDWGTIKLNGLEDGHGLLRPRYTLKAVNRNGTGLYYTIVLLANGHKLHWSVCCFLMMDRYILPFVIWVKTRL